MKTEAGEPKERRAAKRIPFKDNILGEEEGKPRLTGTHCSDCGKYSFPFRPICVFCHSRQVQKTFLSSRGKLHSFTICRVPVPNMAPPYAMGYIDLPEEVMIFSQLTQWNEKELKIGLDMEMVQEKLNSDKEGNEVYTYKFRPIKAAENGR